MILCSCTICKKEFSNKGIHTHYERAHIGRIKFSTGNNGKYQQLSELASQVRKTHLDNYNKTPCKCIQCEKKIEYDKRTNKFCSKSCSATFNNKRKKHTFETKKKIAQSLSGKEYIERTVIDITCKECGEIFTQEIKGTSPHKKTFCSKSCSAKSNNRARYNQLDKNKLKYYRNLAKFSFNLADYPNEFDFTLIEQYGWYTATNHGNNLNGVSRDHMVSVKYGFDNNIDPTIIAHPANCRLIRHNDNVSKGKKNSITYDELLQRIEEWNKKYKILTH